MLEFLKRLLPGRTPAAPTFSILDEEEQPRRGLCTKNGH